MAACLGVVLHCLYVFGLFCLDVLFDFLVVDCLFCLFGFLVFTIS